VFLRRRWRGHVRWIALLAVMLLFAPHPEVRLVGPVLDAIGLDALPMLRGLRHCVLAPALQWLDAGMQRWAGGPHFACVRLAPVATRDDGAPALAAPARAVVGVGAWRGTSRGCAARTPMTEPSRAWHLPVSCAAATVAATFDSP
jgi:hypothetical protein